ncbi:hypothetical protein [Dyella sp. C11]|uniref:hypothetical protein n=1 Tax=Dyella sp. C11 TaxID=2126991 RepID=UPI000D646F58|nr:hypothetical protein [Dyella sp. C11]
MSSIFTNLLFLHGHIADPELARRLADAQNERPKQKGKRERAPMAAQTTRKEVVLPAGLAHNGCG